MNRIIGMAMLMAGAAGFALAGTLVPEIDPASGIAAVTLLAGGLVVLRGRRKK